jgi:pSer/pThr/pTyr-binding forkhead associated (FHA) protein
VNYSKNGTWVNNIRIESDPILLNQFGSKKIVVLLENPKYKDQIQFSFKALTK